MFHLGKQTQTNFPQIKPSRTRTNTQVIENRLNWELQKIWSCETYQPFHEGKTPTWIHKWNRRGEGFLGSNNPTPWQTKLIGDNIRYLFPKLRERLLPLTLCVFSLGDTFPLLLIPTLNQTWKIKERKVKNKD